MNIALFIHEKIQEAGIPIQGIAYGPLRIDFAEEATEEQRELALQIAEQAEADFPKVLAAKEAKDKANQHIESNYALYRQINIARLAQGYTQSDLTTMSTFIDAVRARCHQYEDDIENNQIPEIDYSDINP